MNKLERIILNVDFRDDYNGRPSAEIKDNYIVIKTHPFYCWEKDRYGRCYRYDLYDLNSNSYIQDFKVYVYNSFDSIMDKFITHVYNNLSKQNFVDYNILPSDFKIMKHTKSESNVNLYSLNFTIVKSDMPRKTIMQNFESAKMNSQEYGFIVYKKNIYVIESNLGHYGVYGNDKLVSDYNNTQYCNLYVNNFENVLPNSNYTKINMKQYKRNQHYLEQKEIALKNDPDTKCFRIEYPESDTDSDSDSDSLYVNSVYKNDKQVGQVFSCPGMLDILFINE